MGSQALTTPAERLPDLSKSGDRALAGMFESISKRAHEIVADVLAADSAEGSLPASEISVRTKIAADLVKAERSASRNTNVTNNFLGIIRMPERKTEADWEAMARRVEDEQRRAFMDAQEAHDAGPVAGDTEPPGTVQGDRVAAAAEAPGVDHEPRADVERPGDV